jgi:hypothetical protein
MREVVHHFMKKAKFDDAGCDFSALAQTSLKRKFVPNVQKAHSLLFGNAKRPENAALFVGREASDSLWWHAVDPAILQVGSHRAWRCFGVAQRLSLRKRISECGHNRGEFPAATKGSFLQVSFLSRPRIFGPCCNLAGAFTHF